MLFHLANIYIQISDWSFAAAKEGSSSSNQIQCR